MRYFNWLRNFIILQNTLIFKFREKLRVNIDEAIKLSQNNVFNFIWIFHFPTHPYVTFVAEIRQSNEQIDKRNGTDFFKVEEQSETKSLSSVGYLSVRDSFALYHIQNRFLHSASQCKLIPLCEIFNSIINLNHSILQLS